MKDAGEWTGARTFFQLWTLKEAALKSIGEGLPFGLDAFQFELTRASASSMRHELTVGRSDFAPTRLRSPVAAQLSPSAAMADYPAHDASAEIRYRLLRLQHLKRDG